jgi:hypothetical protein
MRAILVGAGQDLKFWPYAFHCFLRFQMQLQAESPYELFVEQGILFGVVRLGA